MSTWVEDGAPRIELWTGDTGELREPSRRALLRLIRGPYLSADTHGQLWSALVADEAAIRSRLHELFLDLVVDPVRGFAFVRNVEAEGAVPTAVRTETLTFLDTAMLLVLRQLLLTAEGERRVIVGRDEVFEQLQAFRTADRDDADFSRRLNASWQKMRNSLRVVHASERGDTEEDRVEISPVLALIVDAEQVTQLRAEYARIAGEAIAPSSEDNPIDQEEVV
jgi:hypothetical protein